MSARHAELTEAAKAALETLCADKSVSPETTRETLWELRDQIGAMIDGLTEDLTREEA